MAYVKQIVSIVAVLALALVLMQSASASVADLTVEVNGVEAQNGLADIAAFAGQNVPVRVTFTSDMDASDVRIKVWIAGEKDNAVSSERFDLIDGKTYSRLVLLQMPSNIDPDEALKLQVSVESRSEGIISEADVDLTAQRDSYSLNVLDANVAQNVKAGERAQIDIVLKNSGRHLAEDNFVRVRIPALGVEERAYFGDLSSVDQSDPDKEDATEKRMFVSIPRNAPAGLYAIEIEAYNSDTSTSVSKRIAIVGAGEESTVVSPVRSRTFNVGENGQYSLTLANSGNKVRVYELVIEAPNGLTVTADEPVTVVTAGATKTVKLNAVADKAGKYDFSVKVYSDGDLVNTESFTANAEGTKVFAGNMTVLLTVVLAIIFVVLLVVLIVLLTRKPQKSEEFGESYY